MYDGIETTDAAKGVSNGVTRAGLVGLERFDPEARREQARQQAAVEAEIQAQMDAEMAEFIAEEKAELGLADAAQWREKASADFTAEQRAHTTILVSGLTQSHDQFITAAFRGLGYKVKALDCPDTDALRAGKEFGNRGQCNPTYFTVGNLVKTLVQMREGGIPTETIIDRYIFLTAGACGPCRFGTYVTEYRKALRDAGFDGFRVMLFQQKDGLAQATGEELGLELNPKFFVAVIKSLIVGDVLNALAYRIRPYEVEPGSTNVAIDECKAMIEDALGRNKNLVGSLIRCRQRLRRVKVDRSRVKPKVAIIGEFWAMTTEGDGNYQLQRFLESEGAEVDVQLVTAWLLYSLWEVRWDTERRTDLKADDNDDCNGLEGIDPWKRQLTLALADGALRTVFYSVAAVMGLRDYHLPDMDELAEISHRYYDNAARGGEGHMEVGKLIQNVMHHKVNMTISVKPFGCMPSSGVSDGVQSLITALHPSAIFLPIETSGDGAVNVQSRVQMMLFKARQAARKEFDRALGETGLSEDEVREALERDDKLGSSFFKARHRRGSTATDVVYAVAQRVGVRKGPNLANTMKSLVSKLPGMRAEAAA